MIKKKNMSIIKLENITYSYGATNVLDAFNLYFDANNLTCLLGSSGCGKTTILRLIAGLETQQKGSIFIDKLLVSKNNKSIISPEKRKIGFVFQDLALWPHFTVYKNIAFGLEETKAPDIKTKVFEILDYFGIKDQADKYPNQLSGGQKQLVAIARSLVLNPKILLMDEPLANLDVKLKHKILSYIKNIKEQFNITIIYVTHDHKEAFAISDKIIVLNKGKIEAHGNTEEIKSSKNEYVRYFLDY